jgi:MFS transporter, PAT family, beta-lactamase induction signal transducer AmpG
MHDMEPVDANIAAGIAPTVEAAGVVAPANERPWIFGLLIAPSAVVANGVIQGGVLAYLLSQQGIGSGGQSHLIGLLALPTSLYFLWSPITDFLMRRRTWLLAGALASAVLMVAAFHQKNLASTPAAVLMFLSACSSQLVVSSCGGMMGALRLERSRRVAGSFYQCGSLAFGAVAVSVLVWLSPRVSRDLLGLVAAALISVPALFALAAPAQVVIAEVAFGETIRTIWSEFKSTFLCWKAVPYSLCMLFPMASGGAIGLLSGVARSYGVNGDHVAWMNGLGGAVLMGTGTLAATLIPTHIRATVAYLTMGLINAATLAVLWLGPLRPGTYYLGIALYLFTIGTCYSLFTAVVLEFLGKSGKSGSGRYSIINSLGNVPVLYMIVLDGWGGDKWGARGLSGTEAVVGTLGAVALLAYFLTRRNPAVAAP